MNSILADRVCSLKSGENLAPFPLIFNEIGIGENAMGKRIEYQDGQLLGDYGISFIEEIPTGPNVLRRALVKCHCGNIFEARISAIKNNEIKSCGCIWGKNRLIEYTTGEIIGNYGISFIRDIEQRKAKQRLAIFKCHCGNEFETRISDVKSGWIKSCGCRLSEKICSECGSEFLGDYLATHCSICKICICKQCGKSFHAAWKSNRGWEKCCSKECADKDRRNRLISINQYTTIDCLYCKTPIIVKNTKRHRKQRFCSRSCQGAYTAEQGSLRKSKESLSWRQQQMRTQAYKVWHKRVLNRDGYMCKECWDKNEIKNSRPLIVHHIIPTYIDPTKIVEIANGITLCIKCHKKTLAHELEYSDYYFNLLKIPIPIVNGTQSYKQINIPQVLRKMELGYTYKYVAKHFGMSWDTLKNKMGGAIPQYRTYKPGNGTFYSILKLKIAGNNISNIAKTIGTTKNKVVKILKIWGIVIKQEKHKEIGLTGNVIRRTKHISTKELSNLFGVAFETVRRCKLKYEVY